MYSNSRSLIQKTENNHSLCFRNFTGNEAMEADGVRTLCSCESPMFHVPDLPATEQPSGALPPSRGPAQEAAVGGASTVILQECTESIQLDKY